MNIFVLDIDPIKAAQYHCDKHVISQMKESVQMLCTALLHYGNDVPNNKSGNPYKEAYPNHPCTKWVIGGLHNYQWLWDLTLALVEEAEYRFDGEYYIGTILRDGSLPRTPAKYLTPPMRTPFANATADWLKSSDAWDNKSTFNQLNAVDIYRLFYIMDKCHMTAPDMGNANLHWKQRHTLGDEFTDLDIWTNRGAPEFMSDRFYAQQCDYFGIKPAELIHMGRYPDHADSIALKAKMERKMGKKATGQVGTKSKRTTKADVLVAIRDTIGSDGCDGFMKLTMPHMQLVQVSVASNTPDGTGMEMPTGRAKQPYVDALAKLIPSDADYKKMTVAEIKDILAHFGVA
ncbi:putative DNA binding protein [Vibrio phage VCPH]|nr:putative DNA binding protein [Vibrio phage VCPH]